MVELTEAKAKITITLGLTGPGQYNSQHELENIDPVTAAWILIDVGRDILVTALAPMGYPDHEHTEEHPNGN
jgi:hypothetical protein